MDIKTRVIDDEPLARQRIINWLGQYPEIRVVAECKNGFEALQQVSIDPMPFIIFVTAFYQYALDAFEHHAIDYLLKPLDKQRFGKAIEKVILQFKGRLSSSFNDKLRSLLGDYEQQVTPHRETFVIKEKGQVKVIQSDDIFWLESEGNYISLKWQDSHHLYRASMNILESKLTPLQYLRVHRSIMVNFPCL